MLRAEWQAHLDELMDQYQSVRSQMVEFQERMASLEATVTAADELITVTVGAQGRLESLKLDPSVYRKLSVSELAEAIVSAVAEASAQVGDQARVLLEPYVPEGGDLGEVGKIGLSRVLPDRLDDLEGLKERYGLLGRD